MVFTHDTEVALAAASALINTQDALDNVAALDALDAFVGEWEWTGRRDHDRAELDAVRDVRARLAVVWATAVDGNDAGAVVSSVVVHINALLAEFHALPQLVAHDHWDYHLHATESTAPLADRMAVEAAMALVDVVRAGELSRLRRCGNHDCDDVFVDLSRNRSKRYCTLTCTNRAAARAHRARA